jgi:hypothetical protein
MNLSDAILSAIPAQAETVIRWATVTQASPLRVKFPGDSASSAASKLAGYTPTLDKQCVLIRVGAKWTAIGEYA